MKQPGSQFESNDRFVHQAIKVVSGQVRRAFRFRKRPSARGAIFGA